MPLNAGCILFRLAAGDPTCSRQCRSGFRAMLRLQRDGHAASTELQLPLLLAVAFCGVSHAFPGPVAGADDLPRPGILCCEDLRGCIEMARKPALQAVPESPAKLGAARFAPKFLPQPLTHIISSRAM